DDPVEVPAWPAHMERRRWPRDPSARGQNKSSAKSYVKGRFDQSWRQPSRTTVQMKCRTSAPDSACVTVIEKSPSNPSSSTPSGGCSRSPPLSSSRSPRGCSKGKTAIASWKLSRRWKNTDEPSSPNSPGGG
ncbi:hypothetical protein GOE00_31820, partial [Sinorhizobium medicae]|nr:hypothetical protein [Sinorhizobium medicae]